MERNLFLCLMTSLLISSCDPICYHDFYIKNNCKEDIVVSISLNRYHRDSVKTFFIIKSSDKTLIYHGEAIKIHDTISRFFSNIDIKKEEKSVIFNPLDYTEWNSKQTRRKFRDYTDSYLTINPEDFK
jgi:hypothetical protein